MTARSLGISQTDSTQFTQSQGIAQEGNEFNKLLRTIQNEIQSPILEVFDAIRVSQFKQMIINQEQAISNLKNQASVSSTTLMQCQIFQVEISRIKYYLTLYHKTRLMKVHQMARKGCKDTSKLTSEESQLFNAYKSLRENYLHDAGISDPSTDPKQNMSSFVFVRVLIHVDNFKIHPEFVIYWMKY